MNKFFVSNEVYEDRIAICKGCKYYHSLLGNCGICKCFMKVKARISNQSCPKLYWDKTRETETPENLPQDIIDEINNVGKDLIRGRFRDHETKAKAITLYNTIHNTNYSTGTNCGSCLSTTFDGIKKLYNKYKTQ
jgi:hypothetical protein